VKRAFDLILGLPVFVLSLPLMAACALAVRVSSPGPVLFRHHRLGRGGRVFVLYKFRSMYWGAPDLRNSDGSAFAGVADSRVTPAGSFLRRASLDELPQLFNVLRGDMSLVGPRPDLPDQMRFYTPEERGKLEVKPGLTGLAQIRGRNSIPWSERKRFDLEYVNRRSLWLDLQILVRTVPYVVLHRDVYTSGA
jgi:undecaprenyl phosphate N,N'-diacetylbacillosamine 1-phosphate transferase